jgi:hypothetical protein
MTVRVWQTEENRGAATGPATKVLLRPGSPVTSKQLSRYLPPEHGAWAMLLVPFLLGTFSGTPAWSSLLLLAAWLTAYLTSYFSLRWWKARRLQHRGLRYRRPAIGYGAVFALSSAGLVMLEPWLVVAALVFVPFEAIAVALSLHGRERSVVAGVASATAASLMAPVAYRFADGSERSLAVALFVVSWLALTGSVLHVKSTIRKRDDVRYRRASIAFHSVALAIAIVIEPLLALPFGFLLIRAVVVPQHGWRPARIGAVEIVGSLLVVATTFVAL